MLYINEAALTEQVDLLVLRKKYAPILEAASVIESYLNSNKRMLNLSEADIDSIKIKAENFIQDANEYIDEVKAKGDKHHNSAKRNYLIGLGLLLVGLLIPMGSMVTLVLAILALLASIIFSVLSIINSFKNDSEMRNLKAYKDKLIRIKTKSNNPKVRDKIDRIVERIDGIVK